MRHALGKALQRGGEVIGELAIPFRGDSTLSLDGDGMISCAVPIFGRADGRGELDGLGGTLTTAITNKTTVRSSV